MKWTALVPLKAEPLRKSRLAACLSLEERIQLTEQFALHVATAITASPFFGSVIFVGEAPIGNHSFDRVKVEGDDLNQELSRTVEYLDRDRIAIIFADLPLISTRDVNSLVEAASLSGSSIAPDRHERGTNAMALASPSNFRFRFGSQSFALHRRLLPNAWIVRRDGLALDVDTAADLYMALRKRAPSMES